MPYTPEEAIIAKSRYAIVKKSNDIIQKSRFSLTAQQQKIVLYVLSQIREEDEDFKFYQFNIIDFCRICGINDDSGQNYKNLKKAILELRSETRWITLPDGRQTTVSWIDKATIVPNDGVIQIRIDEDLKPYLLQLKDHYTQYELIYVLHFKSKYSIRLYELIKSIHYDESTEYSRAYSLEELRGLLDAEKYVDWMNFKARVLEPAVKEINEYSEKNISYDPMRKPGARGYSSVLLKISTKTTSERIHIDAMIEQEMKVPKDESQQTSIFDDEKIEI